MIFPLQIDTQRALLLYIRWWMLRVACPDSIQLEMKVFLIRRLEELLGDNEELIVLETKCLMEGHKSQEQQLEFIKRTFNTVTICKPVATICPNFLRKFKCLLLVFCYIQPLYSVTVDSSLVSGKSPQLSLSACSAFSPAVTFHSIT